MAVGNFCNLRRKCIGSVMAAEEGDDGGAVFGDGDHWRLGSLVGEMGGNGADEDAAGAEADDGLALLEEFGEMGGCLGVGDIAAAETQSGVWISPFSSALSFWASGRAEMPRMKMAGFTMARCPCRPGWW